MYLRIPNFSSSIIFNKNTDLFSRKRKEQSEF
jgi:hypothetical protein